MGSRIVQISVKPEQVVTTTGALTDQCARFVPDGVAATQEQSC